MFVIPFLGKLTQYLDITVLDEPADALSCFITAFLFIFSAILISAKSNVGSAIECWLPQTYSGPWEEYSENYCFLKDTYWFPNSADIGELDDVHKKEHRLIYYQWSSMYLAVVGIIFMIPKFIWKQSQPVTDVSVLAFCQKAAEIHAQPVEDREEPIKDLARSLRRKLDDRRPRLLLGHIRPYTVYAFVKMMYLANAILQLVILAKFLGQGNNIFWGYTLMRNLMRGYTWETTGMFPRVTFCDFTVREMAGNNRHETVQCTLGINEFNEKIFLFLWIWLLLVIILTSAGMVYSFMSFRSKHVVKDLLREVDSIKDRENVLIHFADRFLRKDGQLVLSYIMSQNEDVAEALAVQLYKDYEEQRAKSHLKHQKLSSSSLLDMEKSAK